MSQLAHDLAALAACLSLIAGTLAMDSRAPQPSTTYAATVIAFDGGAWVIDTGLSADDCAAYAADGAECSPE